MQVFDFDKTVYRNISTFEFCIEAIKREPGLLSYTPIMLKTALKYFTNKLDLNGIEEEIKKYMEVVTERRELIQDISLTFWNESRLRKLNKEVIKLIKPEDVICSTSPSFVVEGVKPLLPTDNIVTTTVDFERGDFFLNFKDNKVKKLKELFPNEEIETLYTDSYTDKPLMKEAKSVVLVKGNRLKKIK